MDELKRFVGTFECRDGSVTILSKTSISELERPSGRYFQSPEDSLDFKPSESCKGAVRYNGLTHSAVVILPTKDIELARKLVPEFNLSPGEDDFITWSEWLDWK